MKPPIPAPAAAIPVAPERPAMRILIPAIRLESVPLMRIALTDYTGNGAEACVAGACQAGVAVNCNDGIDCTDDSCNEDTDSCLNTPNNANCAG